MNTNLIKTIAIIFLAVPITVGLIFKATPASAGTAFDDPATVYKAKCAACHAPAATKFYDPAKPDEEHIRIILKGKKGEKPPYMPAFGEKGMTDGDAKALADYMRELRKPK